MGSAVSRLTIYLSAPSPAIRSSAKPIQASSNTVIDMTKDSKQWRSTYHWLLCTPSAGRHSCYLGAFSNVVLCHSTDSPQLLQDPSQGLNISSLPTLSLLHVTAVDVKHNKRPLYSHPSASHLSFTSSPPGIRRTLAFFKSSPISPC